MAAKKAAPKKAAPKKAAPKKAAPKKAAPKKAAPKAGTKKAAPKKTTAVKLNDNQIALLKRVVDAVAAGGYKCADRKEETSIRSLLTKKLVKAGKKDKATGKAPYLPTATGKKKLPSLVGV
jgi:phage gp29-like protein